MAKFTLTIEGDTTVDGDLLGALCKDAGGGLWMANLHANPDKWSDRKVGDILDAMRRAEPNKPWGVNIEPGVVASSAEEFAKYLRDNHLVLDLGTWEIVPDPTDGKPAARKRKSK